MWLDPRTKLLILALTSISVFLNESIWIECGFVLIPFLLLLQAEKAGTALKSGAFFAILLMIQLWAVPALPAAACGIYPQADSLLSAQLFFNSDDQGQHFSGGD